MSKILKLTISQRNTIITVLSFHHTPVRMTVIQKTNNKCCQGCGKIKDPLQMDSKNRNYCIYYGNKYVITQK